MNPPIHVLLVEDNPGDARLMREYLREAPQANIQLHHVETLGEALERVETERFDVAMLDLSLPDASGLETLNRLLAKAPSLPVVVLTGLDDEALAVKAVREGAQDYLMKGQVNSQLLVRAMRYATERRRAIEALQRSEAYFRSLIVNALDIILVVGADGTVRYGSPSIERVLGFSPNDLWQQSILALTHPEDTPQIRRVLDSGEFTLDEPMDFEARIRHRNGSWRVLEVIGKRFSRETAADGFVLNARDITERKQAEEAIREANETLRAVIATSPLAIIALDMEGRVKSWNKAAERIFGYSEAEAVNQVLPIIFPEDRELFFERLGAAARGQLLAGAEGRRMRRDGTGIDVAVWNAQLRDGTGAVTGVVAAFADITERKRLEEQFRQAQKMEAVGRLAGGVAHDFNNLLTVITGYCTMLLDQFEQENPVYQDIEQVLKAADRATSLTKQLLAFSRKQILQPKVVDLCQLTHDMYHMLKRLVGEDIELRITGLTEGGRVLVDPGQIEQVVVNLVVNARDAMPGGGEITIDLSHANIDQKFAQRQLTMEAGRYVLMGVRDTGIGMDEATKAHLFEPFFTTKEKGRGTGLGLSTSYGIVKQNRGEIIVLSKPGAGSTFQVYLPYAAQPAEAARPARGQGPRRWQGTETILAVEDEDGVRRVLLEMLQQQGYRVLSAGGGSDALALCEKLSGPLHLLITDVVMPKMSGRELADKLRAARPDLAVLFISGYTDSAIVHHGVLEEGTDFLQKPFTGDQLAMKVREVLDRQSGNGNQAVVGGG